MVELLFLFCRQIIVSISIYPIKYKIIVMRRLGSVPALIVSILMGFTSKLPNSGEEDVRNFDMAPIIAYFKGPVLHKRAYIGYVGL